MPIIVNTNIASMTAQRHLGSATYAQSKTLERLSSGFRINRSSDDAAGLQISENLRAQIRGSKKALDNVQDAMNVLNIIDGAHQSIQNIVQRIRELGVQGANDTYGTQQRASAISGEIIQLVNQVNSTIVPSTQFNGRQLISDFPAGTTPFNIQVGANSTANDVIDIGAVTEWADLQNLSNFAPITITMTNHAQALETIQISDIILGNLNRIRGEVGAMYNRLESTASNLQISIENLSASESRIRDADIAMESASMTRNQILQQSSAAILSQANNVPNIALQLLGG